MTTPQQLYRLGDANLGTDWVLQEGGMNLVTHIEIYQAKYDAKAQIVTDIKARSRDKDSDMVRTLKLSDFEKMQLIPTSYPGSFSESCKHAQSSAKSIEAQAEAAETDPP